MTYQCGHGVFSNVVKGVVHTHEGKYQIATCKGGSDWPYLTVLSELIPIVMCVVLLDFENVKIK